MTDRVPVAAAALGGALGAEAALGGVVGAATALGGVVGAAAAFGVVAVDATGPVDPVLIQHVFSQ